MKKESLLTLPNLMTLLRVLLAPVFVWMLYQGKPKMALAVMLVGWLSDFDGVVARFLKQTTTFGAYFDYVADTVFIGTALISAAYYQYIPFWFFAASALLFLLKETGILLQTYQHYHSTLFNKISTYPFYLYLASTLLHYPLASLLWLALLYHGVISIKVFFDGILARV